MHISTCITMLHGNAACMHTGQSTAEITEAYLLLVALLHGLQAAITQEFLEGQSTHIDGPAWRSVVHAFILRHDLVVQHGWANVPCIAKEVVAHNNNGDACWANILLRSCTWQLR